MEELFLVLRGTPPAIDVELDPVVCGISCGSAQGTEQIGVEVGDTRNLVIKDRHAVRDDTISRVKRIAVGPVARDAAGWSGFHDRRRRGGLGQGEVAPPGQNGNRQDRGTKRRLHSVGYAESEPRQLGKVRITMSTRPPTLR